MSLPIDSTEELGPAGEFGPAMAELQPRERLFIAALFQPGTTGAAAARAAGYGKADSKNSTLARIAHRLKSRSHIAKAIVEECQREVKSLGPAAVAAARQIIGNPKHRDQGKMIRFVLDRIDPATTLHHHDVRVTVEDHRVEAVKSLRWLRDELQVPRSVLVEHFGHSGLGMYERMEREQSGGGSPKLIEHDAAPGSVTSERPRITDDDESAG